MEDVTLMKGLHSSTHHCTVNSFFASIPKFCDAGRDSGIGGGGGGGGSLG